MAESKFAGTVITASVILHLYTFEASSSICFKICAEIWAGVLSGMSQDKPSTKGLPIWLLMDRATRWERRGYWTFAKSPTSGS